LISLGATTGGHHALVVIAKERGPSIVHTTFMRWICKS